MAGISFSNTAGMWDGVNGGGRVLLYDANGNPVIQTDKALMSATAQGVPIMGVNDNNNAQFMRVSADASVQMNIPALLLYDNCEGAAVDTNKWTQTATVMTVAQAAATGTQFNAGNSVAINQGAQLVSQRYLPLPKYTGLRFRSRVRHTQHFAGNVIEHGFGAPATAITDSIGNGAVWQKTAAGQYVPTVTINGGVPIIGTPIDNATFVAYVANTEYFDVEVIVWNNRVAFALYASDDGLIPESAQTVRLEGPGVAGFAVTHLQTMHRTWNSAATGTAVQMFATKTAVNLIDRQHEMPYPMQQASTGYAGVTNPVSTYGQLANYGNAAAPTTRTLAAATAAEATKGGLLRVNSIAGGNTDYIMFAYLVPVPYTLWVQGVYIPAPMNEVAAVATTPTIFNYSVGFNGTAVTLATASIFRLPMPGAHYAAVGTAANVSFTGDMVYQEFDPPIPVHGGRYLHVIVREIVGTATATETYYWPGVAIKAFFE